MARFENEKKAAEQEVARSRDLRVQVATFSQTETELRSQLNVYVEKFKQVSRDVLFMRVTLRVCNELRTETAGPVILSPVPQGAIAGPQPRSVYHL